MAVAPKVFTVSLGVRGGLVPGPPWITRQPPAQVCRGKRRVAWAHRLLQCGRTARTATGTGSAPLAASVRVPFWHFLPLLLDDSGVRLVEYACGTPVDAQALCMYLVRCDQCPTRLHPGRPQRGVTLRLPAASPTPRAVTCRQFLLVREVLRSETSVVS